jgi:hypothetical protein
MTTTAASATSAMAMGWRRRGRAPGSGIAPGYVADGAAQAGPGPGVGGAWMGGYAGAIIGAG